MEENSVWSIQLCVYQWLKSAYKGHWAQQGLDRSGTQSIKTSRASKHSM